MRRNARSTGNTKSKGIPGGETGPINIGPNMSMAAINKNTTMEPWPHTSGCLILVPTENYLAPLQLKED
ncbi:hypothetical protein SESBI_08742 [Sesbania bispinosa]|nr:hypothetical protein SESBI_08742 [Sesbania bispinosa]